MRVPLFTRKPNFFSCAASVPARGCPPQGFCPQEGPAATFARLLAKLIKRADPRDGSQRGIRLCRGQKSFRNSAEIRAR